MWARIYYCTTHIFWNKPSSSRFLGLHFCFFFFGFSMYLHDPSYLCTVWRKIMINHINHIIHYLFLKVIKVLIILLATYNEALVTFNLPIRKFRLELSSHFLFKTRFHLIQRSETCLSFLSTIHPVTSFLSTIHPVTSFLSTIHPVRVSRWTFHTNDMWYVFLTHPHRTKVPTAIWQEYVPTWSGMMWMLLNL